MQEKTQTVKEVDRNCKLYKEEVIKAQKIEALIKELKAILPEFGRQIEDYSACALEDLNEIKTEAVNELFYEKKCPFVNSCMSQLQYTLCQAYSRHSSNIENEIGRKFDKWIGGETIEI